MGICRSNFNRVTPTTNTSSDSEDDDEKPPAFRSPKLKHRRNTLSYISSFELARKINESMTRKIHEQLGTPTATLENSQNEYDIMSQKHI